MTVSFHAGHLALELSFKASTVCETSQVVRKSRFFTRVQVGFELEQCPGPCKQQIEIRRISNIAQSAGFISPAEIFASSARRGLHDYGNKLRDRVGPDPLGQLVPVHARHHDVGYHEIRLERLDGRERLISVCGRGYVVTGEVQRRFDQVQFIGIIVDYEDVGF